MSEKSISQVVAENLRYWMAQAELSQAALGSRAGVNQKTISNYLNPGQRQKSASGKEPSPKLEELDRIARALAIPVWQLVREMTEKERRMYEHIERAYAELIAADQEIPAVNVTNGGEGQLSGKKGALGRLPGELVRTGREGRDQSGSDRLGAPPRKRRG